MGSSRIVTPLRAAALVAALLVAGCTSEDTSRDPGSPTTDVGDPGSLSWGGCSEFDIDADRTVIAAAEAGGLECATLEVPVDHDDPDGATTTIALARYAATDRTARIGSLLTNPGGPGGSGLQFLVNVGMILPADLRARFDVVSFDPRGLGASDPLECLSPDEREQWITTDDPLDTDADAVEARAVRLEEEIVAGCVADDEDLFRNIGTDSVVDDLDLIREALGDEQLTFLGLSYGTRIGAAYATRYPERVRAIALDSPVTPSPSLADLTAGQQRGIERAVRAFVDWCSGNAECAIADDPLGTLRSVAVQLRDQPIEPSDPDDLTLDDGTFTTAVITAMYDPAYSLPLAEAVDAIARRTGETDTAVGFLGDLAAMQWSRREDGTFGNGLEIQSLVNCADANDPLTRQEARSIDGRVDDLLLGMDLPITSSCTVVPTGTPPEIGDRGIGDRLLVIGTVGDPATPYEWMSEMADALGAAHRLTYGGNGHGPSLSRECVTGQLVSFLVEPAAFSATDCDASRTERDIYSTVSNQFIAMGLPESMTTCVVDRLRERVSPLRVASEGSDASSELVGVISGIVLACR